MNLLKEMFLIGVERRTFIFFIGLLLFAVLLNVVGVFTDNRLLLTLSISLIFTTLLLFYVFSVKKRDILSLCYLFSILIAEVLFLFKEKYFVWVSLLYTFAQCMLIIHILKLKHIKFKNSLIYFVLLFLSFVLVFFFVLDIEQNKFVIIPYGLSVCLSVSFAMANYMKKMYLANYLLFLGAAFTVLSNAIIAIHMFEGITNIYLLLTNMLTHLFICMSFIARVNRRKRNSNL